MPHLSLIHISRAGNADVGAALVDDRGGGAHAAKVDVFGRVSLDLAACPVDLLAVEMSALGGEVDAVGGGIIGDVRTDVADVASLDVYKRQ